MKGAVQRRIEQDVDENDRDFRKIRTAEALKKAGKTIIIGTAFFIGSQEAMAAFDPNTINLAEKVGILKTKNAENASETILARLAGPDYSTSVSQTVVENIRGDQEVEIQRLEQHGYEPVQVKAAYSTTETKLADVPPSSSAHALNVRTQFANNGTIQADGNEVRLYLENGHYVAKMTGNSTMGDTVFNYEQLAQAGKIKGHIEIGGGVFEVAATPSDVSGQFAWPISSDGLVTTTTGETIQAFGANGEKLFKSFRVVAENGVGNDGIQQVVSLAADPGADTFTGTITEAVETITEIGRAHV